MLPGLLIILQLQLAAGRIQFAGLLQVLSLGLVRFLHVVSVIEDLDDLLVTTKCHLNPASTEMIGANFLSCCTKLNLLILIHIPGLLALFKFQELQCEHCLLGRDFFQAQLLFTQDRRFGASEHSLLALLHVEHSKLQGVTDFAIACDELQCLSFESWEAACHSLCDAQLDLRSFYGRVVAITFHHLLLYQRSVFGKRDILALKDLFQDQ
mmetsp:Transcript_32938/g.61409  ORF Transcript_32938/g.61409 Transcript_32938/m.61409 type:complete len:210 (-) Transcript_32938:818-1447(-)